MVHSYSYLSPLYISIDLIPELFDVKQFLKKEENFINLKWKLGKVMNTGYINKMKVKYLTSYIFVPKVEYNIHMVYNCISSGINYLFWST